MTSNQDAANPTDSQTDEVNIRIIALAHATNENEDLYITLSLDTSISQLKQRLQQSLRNHPQPETQRLIYQGRPLVDGSASLRQTLRLDVCVPDQNKLMLETAGANLKKPSSTNSSVVHVIHLVVRETQANIPPSTTGAAQTNQPQAQPQVLSGNEFPQAHLGQPHPPPPFNLPQNALPQGHPAQAMLQNVMQQHMAIHNQHLNRQLPNGPQLPFHVPAINIQQLPRIPSVVNNQNGPVGSQAEAHPTPNMVRSQSNTPSIQNPIMNNVPGVFQTAMSMRVQETVGPNGERIQRVVQNGTLFPGLNPVERSASAPGGPRSTNPGAPGRPGINTSNVQPMFPQFQHTQPAALHQPFLRPSTALWNSSHLNLMPQPRQPVAFLVSSPNGPEALLFAPNHGYFSSQQTSTTQSSTSTQVQHADPTIQSPQNVQPQPVHQPQDDARNEGQGLGQVAVRAPAPLGGGQAQAQAQGRREGEDMIAMFLQRGWLFLRLYMFIFVLSEPGTWRRYILLTIASLVCLLPRNNPFTDLFQLARRHFDNLIGPPQAPGQPQQPRHRNEPLAQQNNNGATTTASTTAESGSAADTTRTRMPTPQEHAQRLLHGRRQQNPSVIRDTIYRIEQALALFLASLIPGVGERHVRAREEARRLIQEEEERRRREEENQPQQTDDLAVDKSDVPDTGSSSSGPVQVGSNATSTAVDTSSSTSASTSAASEGLRMRGGNSDGQTA